MDSEELNSYFERRLLKEIAAIERQLMDLEHEKKSLQKQLFKAKSVGGQTSGTVRSDGMNRALVESLVLHDLRSAGSPLPLSKLYNAALELVPELRENTFRTQISRMKDKELIQSAGHGKWKLFKG